MLKTLCPTSFRRYSSLAIFGLFVDGFSACDRQSEARCRSCFFFLAAKSLCSRMAGESLTCSVMWSPPAQQTDPNRHTGQSTSHY